jgi:hypothetical protein
MAVVAGVAIVDNLNVGKFLDCLEEARLPLTRAYRTLFKANEHHLAFAV